MIITLSPVRSDETLQLSRQGDALTVNGVEYDFSVLPDGATLPADAIESDWIIGDVERIAGQIHIMIRLPHGPRAPESQRFPEPIIDPADGEVSLP